MEPVESGNIEECLEEVVELDIVERPEEFDELEVDIEEFGNR